MGGAYSEGGAYWKEGAKSNHYGSCNHSLVLCLYTCNCLEMFSVKIIEQKIKMDWYQSREE